MPLPYARATLTLDRIQFRDLAALYKTAYDATHAANKQRYDELGAQLQSQETDEDDKPALAAELELIRDRTFGPDALAGTHEIYAIAQIVIHDLAPKAEFRSPPIAHDARALALGWAGTFDVMADQALSVRLAIWVDRGDAAPLRLAVHQLLMPAVSDYPEGSEVLEPTVNRADTVRLEATLGCARIALPVLRSGVARSTDERSGNVNRLAPTPIVHVELTRIDGLYRPVDPAWIDGGVYQQSTHHAGYLSRDCLGRIFTSRGLDGAWTPFAQSIELFARITSPGQAAAVAQLRERIANLTWVAEPTLKDPLLLTPFRHRDTTDTIAHGLRGFADRGGLHRFQWQLHGSDARVSASTVDTPVAWQAERGDAIGTARVRLHCPHVAGDQFLVRTQLPVSPAYRGFDARTGVMTMWKRIYVDYHQMQTAADLPVADVPAVFEPACVELVFVRGRRLDAVTPLVDSADAALVEPGVVRYLTDTLGPPAAGRIQLVSATTPCRVGEPSPGDEAMLDARIGYAERRVAGEGVDNAGYFSLTYLEIEGDLTQRGFQLASMNLGNRTYVSAPLLDCQLVDGRTRFWVTGHDLAVSFTRCNGSLAASTIGTRRFFPGKQSDAPFEPTGRYEAFARIQNEDGGYPVADVNAIRVHLAGGASGTELPDGISPEITHDGARWFSGRTMLFTTLPDYEAGAQANVIAHELCHAFGLPHKCARYDTRVPRIGTCCMNYPGYWMLIGDRFVAGRDFDRFDGRLCARHIRALRDVRLEDNLALGWR